MSGKIHTELRLRHRKELTCQLTTVHKPPILTFDLDNIDYPRKGRPIPLGQAADAHMVRQYTIKYIVYLYVFYRMVYVSSVI